MKFSSFDLATYTYYKESIEKIRVENHWGILKLCEKIPINPRTYYKLQKLDTAKDLSFVVLKRIKRFIEKYL